MANYTITLRVERMHIHATRGVDADKDSVHAQISVVDPSMPEAVRIRHAAQHTCTPHQFALAGTDLPLANQVAGWNDGEEHWNQSLQFGISANDKWLIGFAYFAINQSHEAHSDTTKERLLKTVNAFSQGLALGATLSAAIPGVGWAFAAVQGALSGALQGAKKIIEAFFPDDDPPVNCDGEVITGGDLIPVAAIVENTNNGAVPWTFSHRKVGPAGPSACNGPADSELFFRIECKEIPTFEDILLPGNPDTFRREPMFGQPASIWAGAWGDKPDRATCRIVVSVVPPRRPRRNQGALQKYSVDFEERDTGANGTVHASGNSIRTFETVESAVAIRRPGGTSVNEPVARLRIQSADTLVLSDNVKVQLYAVYNKYRVFLSHEMRYVRRNHNGSVASDVMLVRTYNLG